MFKSLLLSKPIRLTTYQLFNTNINKFKLKEASPLK